MPLQIHCIDSVVPYLDEILQKLMEKHFGLNLQDSFLALTPDRFSLQDLEHQILQKPLSQNILIGNNANTLDSWLRAILDLQVKKLKIATPYLERKAVQRVLTKPFETRGMDAKTTQAYVSELKCLEKFYPVLKNVSPQSSQLLKNYQKFLNETLEVWTEEQAYRHAVQCILRRQVPSLEFIQEIFFLGFQSLDFRLASCIESLISAYPEIQIYLFLPPPESSLDSEGILQDAWNSLREKSENIFIHRAVQPAQAQWHQHPTPWHENLWTLQSFDPRLDAIFFPKAPQNSEWFQIEDDFFSSLEIFPVKSSKSPSTLFQKIFEVLENQKDDNVDFDRLLQAIFPSLEKLRVDFAKMRDFPALKQLESHHESLKKIRNYETKFPERKPVDQWIEELTEEFSFGSPDPFKNPPDGVRNLDSHALRTWRKVFILSLNEHQFPPPAPQHFLTHAHPMPLYAHDKRLAFREKLYLARDTVHLSYPSHDMQGRKLSASLLKTDSEKAAPTLWSPKEALSIDSLPDYYRENLQRERNRIRSPGFNEDNGNLENLNIAEAMRLKLKQRPLSASYIDDYAKCPWRFFAHWHLGLESPQEDSLEMEARFRGSLIHRYLEKVYASLTDDFFNHEKIPSLVEIEAVIKANLEVMRLEVSELDDSRKIHPTILEDEFHRMLKRISLLLTQEHEDWTQAKKRLSPKHLEWTFGKNSENPVEFAISPGVKIPLSGAIDRIDIDENSGELLIIDYKSSSSGDLAKLIRDKLSFQIFIYLYAVKNSLYKDMKPIGGLYWDLNSIKKNQGMVLKENYQDYSIQSLRSTSFFKEESYHGLMQSLDEQLRVNLSAILQGDYRLEPKKCDEDRCPYHEICRYEKKS